MSKEIQTRQQVQVSSRHLLNSISRNDSAQIMQNVAQYAERGLIKFDMILSIPLKSRIPSLTNIYGFQKIHIVVAALLKSFNDSMNLIRPMTDEQMTETAYALVATAEEDQLAIEDLVLFFKGAKEGKYGKILDRLDQQTVFEMLEQYRQQRYQALIRIEESRHLENKGMGATERTCQPDPLRDQMYNLSGRIAELSEKLKEQKEINRANRL